MVPTMFGVVGDVFDVVPLDYKLRDSVDDRSIYAGLNRKRRNNRSCPERKRTTRDVPSSFRIGRFSLRRKSQTGMLEVEVESECIGSSAVRSGG